MNIYDKLDLHEMDLDALDTIDAMLFNGDSLNTKKNVKHFKKLMVRWAKKVSDISDFVNELEREEKEKSIIGKNVIINKTESLPHGETGEVIKFDKKVGKFEVNFHNGFHGWFNFDELKVD